jgi:putative ABC transport system substrate-binding protein
MRRREFIAAVGSAAALPFGAYAQQSARPVVGFLAAGTPTGYGHALAAFQKGLGETDYLDGKNVEIVYRWAENQYDRLPAMASELIRRRVSVIAALSTPAALVAKAATTTIPVVFTTIADPVQIGLVNSLNRPGGNVTGATLMSVEVGPRLLDLLHTALPSVTTIAVLLNPTNPNLETQSSTLRAAALKLGLQIEVLDVRSESEFDAVFAKLRELRAGAVMISQDPLFNAKSEQLAALTIRYRVPAIYELRQFAVAGGLMSYGDSQNEAWRQAGLYVGRILKGEKPADLPVMQATKLEFVINLKTARTFGLTVPDGLVNAADEVIE